MDKLHMQEHHPYRWIIMLVVFLTQLILNLNIFQLAGLASSLIPAMHLQASEFAILLSVPMLACAVLGIFTGGLADRFGVKSVIGIALVVNVIGAFGRIGAGGFWSLLIWMFALGIGMAALNSNAVKILGVWFPPEKMNMAMGLYVASANVGIALALATTPLFSSAETAFTSSALMSAFILILWFLLIKSRPAGTPAAERQPFTAYLAVAAKSKNNWIGAIAMFFYMGSYITQTGFLSNALTQAKGIEPVTAGIAASTISLAFIVGTVIGPPLSSRIGLLKPFIIPASLIAGILTWVFWIIPFSSLTIILLAVEGILLGATVPILMSLPMMLPEVGPVYAGSAGGIISTMQMTGAFFISSYIIMPLAGTSINTVFLLTGIGYALIAAVTIFLPELGTGRKNL